MTKRMMFTLSLMYAMALMASSQPSRGLKITVRDGTGDIRTLTIGVDPRGTYGFDPMFGELPLPPPPPDWLFDARLLDPQGRKQYKRDGAASDIRAFVSQKQIDTFYVRIQTRKWPVTLSWDASVKSWSDSLVVRTTSAPIPIMALGVQQRVTLNNDKSSSLLIILNGPRIQ